MNNIYRYQYIFHGRVQGVGFRYTAYNAARSAGLTGWVRNEYDGSVKMQIQGNSEQIAFVLSSLQRGTFIQIDEIEKKELEVRNDESSFQVR
ncbi:MAG: acylphosphatase [Treponemataceae bacterium]|nr:acylphosphatase [Treponemataceae bacterium]